MKTLLLLPASVVALAFTHNLAGTSLPASDRALAGHEWALAEHEWVVDPAHSSVVFRVKHAGAAWFQGAFDKVEGGITLDSTKPEAGAVHLSIPVESIDTNDAKRDGHLKAPDFFNAKENPSIEFTSRKIEKHGEDKYHVTGKLAMAGKEKEVTIPVEKTGTGEFYGPREGWMAEFTIKRSDFGMTYGIAQNSLGDEVTLTIALEMVKPKK